MAEVKLTKNELREQQVKLAQLERYLPTLQLKKAMLQAEVNTARLEIRALEGELSSQHKAVEEYSSLFSQTGDFHADEAVRVKQVNKRYENIAGVEIPHYEGIIFEPFTYSLLVTPAWVDSAIAGLRRMSEAQARVQVAREKATALENELRNVSIRVNLFEKVLVPRTRDNIKKIKVFLGDQQLAAVSQAKVAKAKILRRKAEVAP